MMWEKTQLKRDNFNWNIAEEIKNESKYFLLKRQECDAYWSANTNDS